MTGMATPSTWRWDLTPRSGRATSSRSLTVHFPAIAPGTPCQRRVLGRCFPPGVVASVLILEEGRKLGLAVLGRLRRSAAPAGSL